MSLPDLAATIGVHDTRTQPQSASHTAAPESSGGRGTSEGGDGRLAAGATAAGDTVGLVGDVADDAEAEELCARAQGHVPYHASPEGGECDVGSVERSVERSASLSAASSSGHGGGSLEGSEELEDEAVALWHLRMRELVGYDDGKPRQTASATESFKEETVQGSAAYLMQPSEWSVLPTVEYTPQFCSHDDSSSVSDQVRTRTRDR